MKRLTALIITLIICLSAALPVFAETVELDPFTGEVRGVVTEDTVRIHLSPYCDYNRETNCYEYVSPSRPEDIIRTTAFDGMTTHPGVSIVVDDSVTVKLYLEGELVDRSEYEQLTDTGVYVMLSENDERIFGFTIIGERSGFLNEFTLPSGFSITEVTRDDVKIRYENRSVPTEIEGRYSIKYKNDISDVNYTLNIYVDHKAPELVFEGLDEEMTARGPVDLVDQDDAVYLEVTLDGETIAVPKQFTRPGTYTVTAWDDADNVSETSFVIKAYFNLSAWAALAILVAVIGAMIFYIVYNRRNLKVR